MDDATAAALQTIASPRSEASQAPSVVDSAAVQQLLGVLGEDVSSLQATQLLFRTKGDVARAVNEFYEPSPAVSASAGAGISSAASALPPQKDQAVSKGMAASWKWTCACAVFSQSLFLELSALASCRRVLCMFSNKLFPRIGADSGETSHTIICNE